MTPKSLSPAILPPATLGVLGGGQLGKMFCSAAQRMGYKVWVLDPDPNCPTSTIADRHLCAEFNDAEALEMLGTHCAAVTTEFENAPAESLALLQKWCVVSPEAESVAIVQHRWQEKSFLRAHNIPTTDFWKIETVEDLQHIPESAYPAILKTSRLGYDGKGQVTVNSPEKLMEAWQHLHKTPCILEHRLYLDGEISVMVARGRDGHAVTWSVAENIHRAGILDISIVPARIPTALAQHAQELALAIAEGLHYIGILGVELFLSNGCLYVNELAPRPHNSGHYTIEASITSQFEQQVRTLCHLTLSDTALLCPAVMLNLLGDLWFPQTPDWKSLLSFPNIKLHLYGKQTPRNRRKMGHLTCIAPNLDEALAQVTLARNQLHLLLT
jgi:5-(carboxyamino)imidazole ribonucleotide synthase